MDPDAVGWKPPESKDESKPGKVMDLMDFSGNMQFPWFRVRAIHLMALPTAFQRPRHPEAYCAESRNQTLEGLGQE